LPNIDFMKDKEKAATALEIAEAAWLSLEDKKGSDIALLDVRGLSEVTDFCLLVSGTSPPHLKAMFEEIQHSLKAQGLHCYRRSGNPESGWLILDYVDVVIHMFLPEVRRYYAIEDLWPTAPRR
jgi:ribosome-associated protein